MKVRDEIRIKTDRKDEIRRMFQAYANSGNVFRIPKTDLENPREWLESKYLASDTEYLLYCEFKNLYLDGGDKEMLTWPGIEIA
jgi:hypothetical protein